MTDNLDGPWTGAALLCEQVLQERDGVLSFIRIVDRFVRPRPTAQIPPQTIHLHLAIMLKSGGVPTGNYQVKIRIFKPDATTPAMEISNDAFFEGGEDRGVNIVSPLILLADEEGVYSIEVRFMDKLITRVPFRVILVASPVVPIQPPTPGE
jgi:hypothetical protein